MQTGSTCRRKISWELMKKTQEPAAGQSYWDCLCEVGICSSCWWAGLDFWWSRKEALRDLLSPSRLRSPKKWNSCGGCCGKQEVDERILWGWNLKRGSGLGSLPKPVSRRQTWGVWCGSQVGASLGQDPGAKWVLQERWVNNEGLSWPKIEI